MSDKNRWADSMTADTLCAGVYIFPPAACRLTYNKTLFPGWNRHAPETQPAGFLSPFWITLVPARRFENQRAGSRAANAASALNMTAALVPRIALCGQLLSSKRQPAHRTIRQSVASGWRKKKKLKKREALKHTTHLLHYLSNTEDEKKWKSQITPYKPRYVNSLSQGSRRRAATCIIRIQLEARFYFTYI